MVRLLKQCEGTVITSPKIYKGLSSDEKVWLSSPVVNVEIKPEEMKEYFDAMKEWARTRR